MEPKVSVIIPIFNVEDYVEKCLLSVMNQTLFEIEIICIDDASTDASYEKAKGCISRDSRFQLFHLPENRGLSYARNYGIRKASGKYIYFLDSDDYLENVTLEKLVKCAEELNVQGVFFGAFVEYEDDPDINEKIEYKDCGKILSGQDFFVEKNQCNEYQNAVCFQFWKRSYINENNLMFYEGVTYEDTLFTLNALLIADDVTCINDKFYHYVKRQTSITGRQGKEQLKSYMIVYFEVWKIWMNSKNINEISEGIQKRLEVFHRRISMAIGQLGYVPNLQFESKACQYLYEKIVQIAPDRHYVEQIDNRKIEILKRKDLVFVYGAGIIADEIIRILEREEVKISGIIVTKKDEDLKQYKGYSVFELKEIENRQGMVGVVPGLSKRYHEKIKMFIKNIGYEWIDVLGSSEKE